MQKDELRSHDIALAVAPLLGSGWSYLPNTRDGHLTDTANLVHADGYEIGLTAGGYNLKGRLSVHGVFPRTKKGEWVRPGDCGGWPRETATEITVAIERPVEQIAKDIARRFLPKYQEQWTRCRAVAQRRDEHEAEQNATKARLAALPGVEFWKHGEGRHATVHFPNSDRRGELEMYSDNDLKLTLHMNMAEFQEVLALLRAVREAKARPVQD